MLCKAALRGNSNMYLPISNYSATTTLPPNPPHTHYRILILPPTYLRAGNGFNLLEHNCVTFEKYSWIFSVDPEQPTTPCSLHYHYLKLVLPTELNMTTCDTDMHK